MPADFPTLTGPLWAKALQEVRIRRAMRRAEVTRTIKESLTLQHMKHPTKVTLEITADGYKVTVYGRLNVLVEQEMKMQPDGTAKGGKRPFIEEVIESWDKDGGFDDLAEAVSGLCGFETATELARIREALG